MDEVDDRGAEHVCRHPTQHLAGDAVAVQERAIGGERENRVTQPVDRRHVRNDS
jgi:hypothetical protein